MREFYFLLLKVELTIWLKPETQNKKKRRKKMKKKQRERKLGHAKSNRFLFSDTKSISDSHNKQSVVFRSTPRHIQCCLNELISNEDHFHCNIVWDLDVDAIKHGE